MTFWIKVSLDDYSVLNPVNAVRWEPVRVMIKNCIVTDFTFSQQADVHYNLYTPVVYIPMSTFTEVDQAGFIKTGSSCGYTVTYTPKWRNYWGTVIDLPSFIIWNPTDFRFEVQSSDLIDLTN